MINELAQAIRDMARTGRLSEESEENISAILDKPADDDSEGNDEKSDDTDAEVSEPPEKSGETQSRTSTDTTPEKGKK